MPACGGEQDERKTVYGLITVLASILILLGVKRGVALNIIGATLCFAAIVLCLFDLSKGFSLGECFTIFSSAFCLYCDGVIIGFKKRP